MSTTNELMHYGVLGMKWGVRKDPNKTVFVSGSSKTQSKDSEYYRRKLPKQIRRELNDHIYMNIFIAICFFS